MTEHLTDLEIYELAGGNGVSPARAAHVAECTACTTELEETRRLLAAVGELGPRVEAPAGVEAELDRRIRGGAEVPRWNSMSRFAAAAAAILCFAAGAFSHALWRGGASGGDAGDGAAVPALAVQRAGTEYVAALARMADDANRLSPADRRTGREVALAAMSGAAYELVRLGGPDPVTVDIHRSIEEAWLGVPTGGTP